MVDSLTIAHNNYIGLGPARRDCLRDPKPLSLLMIPMDSRDLLVACISTALGATINYGLLFNPAWLFRLRTPQMLEQNLGRTRAGWVLGSTGTALILLGVYLAFSPMFQSGPNAKNGIPQPAADTQPPNFLVPQQAGSSHPKMAQPISKL